MSEPAGQWSPRKKIGYIAFVVGMVVVITSASAYMVTAVDRRWTPGSIALTVVSGIMVVVSGICINVLPKTVTTIWRNPERLPAPGDPRWLLRVLTKPFRVLLILATVVVIVAVGIAAIPPATGLEPGPIRVMTAFGEGASDPRTVLFRQWSQSHPDNPVQVEFVQGETDQQYERMVNDAKPGGEHKADLYVLDLVWMPQFAANGYVRELDRASISETDRSDFTPSVLDTCAWDGKLYGLPFNTDAGLIFYRTDVPGVAKPDTWDDYFGASAKAEAAVAKAGPYGVKAANAAQLADEEVLTVTALEAIWAAGGKMVTVNGDLTLNPDGTEVALGAEDLKGIENLALAAKDPDLVLTENDTAAKSAESGALDSFRSKTTLYMRNWPVAADSLGKSVEFAVAAPPTSSVLGGQNLAIASSTDKPRAARALADFLTSPSSQLILSDMGSFAPTRQSTYRFSERTDVNEVRAAVERARPRPITPHYTRFSQVFRTGILRALNNGGKVEESFARDLVEAWNGR
ncbi:extracellular solute-binding protein [Umezawaea endophytica]|uniref:Extracellular solute-binding protein n=1 Tax=Umezawaea endophytica TaxID=1654476 RepID=A0A9X2VYH1_9PSEU|nr:extracellular solute-binding protein [Umezawaea endophytica]MCS7484722.1 extracellular solute-binding protein [Umezawaea endophytica]